MLSEGTIQNLQRIIKEEYNKDVTMEEATEIANTLVGYYDLLGRIYHEIKTDEINNENHESK